MFIKINELYNFLTKNGHQRLAKVLEKIALEESGFKDKYPNIYSTWNEKRDKPLSAYLAQISRAENKGIDLSKETISSFQDIIQILRGEKQRSKSSKAEEVLAALRESGAERITEGEVELAFGVGLNKEEIIFLAKDKCNHTWKEKLHYADKFKKERLALFDENTKLTDFKDIDEVRDEYFSRKNSAPMDLQEFYEGIKDQGLKDSEVIYNSKNYIVVHSKTEKAAQYWEQSCVTVNDKGVVSSGLCSAHPYESMFDEYDDEIHSFQIITKEYETLKETPRTSFMTKNERYNLITLSINKYSGDVAWGGQDTVNRYNEPVGAAALFFALGDEYEEICEKISDYCERNLKINVSKLKISEEKANQKLTIDQFIGMGLNKKLKSHKLNNLSDLYMKFISNHDKFPEIFYDGQIDSVNFFKKTEEIPKEFFDGLASEIAKTLDPSTFLNLKDKIPDEVFNEHIEEMVSNLKKNDFFIHAEDMPRKVFLDFLPEKAKEIDGGLFFVWAKNIPKEGFEDLFAQKARELKPGLFFMHKDKMPTQVYENLSYEKARALSPREFFYDPDKFPRETLQSLALDKAKELDAVSFFNFYKKVPKEIFNSLASEKAKDLRPFDFFNSKDKIPEDVFKDLALEKARGFSPSEFFRNKERIPLDLFDRLSHSKAREFAETAFFLASHLMPQDLFESFAKEKAQKMRPDDFFYYKIKIPNDIFSDLALEKAKALSDDELSMFSKKIPKEILDMLQR